MSPSGSRAATRLPTSAPGGVFSATLNVWERLEKAGFLLASSGIRRSRARARPVAVTFRALRPHLHLVARAGRQPRYDRAPVRVTSGNRHPLKSVKLLPANGVLNAVVSDGLAPCSLARPT